MLKSKSLATQSSNEVSDFSNFKADKESLVIIRSIYTNF